MVNVVSPVSRVVGDGRRWRERRVRVQVVSALVAAASMVAVAGCGTTEPAPTVTATATTTPDAQMSKSAPPEPEVTPVWPLTGRETSKDTDRPVVSVKVENSASARPQSGLEDADVVWETIVEFDVSRLIAVFHSRYGRDVGPIRSVRPMDPTVVAPLGGALVYSGGQSGILKLARGMSTVTTIDENNASGSMWRARGRYAPHNLYGDTTKMAGLVGKKYASEPKEQFAFAPDAASATAVTQGRRSNGASLVMSSLSAPSWTWNSDDKTFMRFEGGSAHVSATAGQLSAVNVVVIEAKHIDSGFNAQNNAPVPDYVLTGTGKAIVWSHGHVVRGTWHKKKKSSALVLRTTGGEELLLAPGNTWVELLPQGKGTVTVK